MSWLGRLWTPLKPRRRGEMTRRFRAWFEALENRRTPSTLFVSASNLTGVEDGTAQHPYHLIQTALDHTTDGDVVNVAAGTYAESLHIDHAISLLGPNAGINPNAATRSAEAVVIPPVTGNRGIAMLVEASNVTIDGFTLDGHNDAISDGTLLNGVTVSAWAGVTNVDNTGLGFENNHLVIQDNIIRNFTRFGIYGGADNYDGRSYVSTENVISNNLIDNMPTVDVAPIGTISQGRGVSLEDSFYAAVTGNVITRTATGIQVIYALNPPGGTGYATTIAANHVQAYDRGIFVYTVDDGNAQAVALTGNTVSSDPTNGPTATAIGIDVERVLGDSGISLVGNNVSAFPVGLQIGYSPTTTSVVVSGGTLSGNDVGVRLVNTSPPRGTTQPQPVAATLNGVTIRGSSQEGIEILDTLSQAGATVSLTAGPGTSVQGSPHGVELVGPNTSFVATTAPAVAFTQTPPATTTSTTATFQFAASDNVSVPADMSYQYALDGGAWTPASATNPIALAGLSLGSHQLVIRASNQGGLTGTTTYSWAVQPVTAPPPAAPTLAAGSDTGASATDGVTRDTTPQFGGTVSPKATVLIYANGSQIGSARAGALGNWSFTVGNTRSLVPSLAPGTYAITIAVADPSGTPGPQSDPLTITVDRSAPALTLSTNVMPEGIFGMPTIPVVFSGNATDNSGTAPTVTYLVKNAAGKVVASGTAVVAADGTYRVMINLTPPALGATNGQRTYRVTIKGVDLAGNSASLNASFRLPPATTMTSANHVSNRCRHGARHHHF